MVCTRRSGQRLHGVDFCVCAHVSVCVCVCVNKISESECVAHPRGLAAGAVYNYKAASSGPHLLAFLLLVSMILFL